jgi:hypothetical protein
MDAPFQLLLWIGNGSNQPYPRQDKTGKRKGKQKEEEEKKSSGLSRATATATATATQTTGADRARQIWAGLTSMATEEEAQQLPYPCSLSSAEDLCVSE